MKILHISSENSWRGGEQQIAYLIEELESKGVQNIVLCQKKSPFEMYCQKHSISHVSISFSGFLWFLRAAFEVKNICTYAEVNILHMHSSKGHTVGVLSAVFGNKSKLILHRRVDFPVKDNFFSRFKYNYSKIKKIICVSHKVSDVLAKDIKQKNKIAVVHSGIDLKRFEASKNHHILRSQFNVDSNVPLVANISAIAPHKDYFTFVDTAYHFISSGGKAKFFIIGEGECREEIEQYIKQKNMSEHIILTGFREDITNIIKEIDVFLITSKTEGLGTTVLDAFANKIPVVATNGGGISEMVKDGYNGFLSDVGDFKNLSSNIQKLLQDSELKISITENAFNTVKEKFTEEKMAEEVYKIYKNIF